MGYDGARIMQRAATIPAALDEVARRSAWSTAWHTTDASGPRTHAWGEVVRRAHDVAAGLSERGVAAGDLVAVAAGPGLRAQVAEYAVLCAGAAVLDVSASSPAALAASWTRLAPRLVLADADGAALLTELVAELVAGSPASPVLRIDGDATEDAWPSLVAAGAAALACVPGLVAERVATVEAASPAVVVVDDELGEVVLHHGSQTYQGAALASLGVLAEGDVLLLAGASPLLTRAALAGHLMSGSAAATVRPDAAASWPVVAGRPVLVTGPAHLETTARFLAEDDHVRLCLTEAPVDLERLRAGTAGVALASTSPVGGGICALALDPVAPGLVGEALPYSSLRVEDGDRLSLKGPGAPLTGGDGLWHALGVRAALDGSGRLVRVDDAAPGQPDAPVVELLVEPVVEEPIAVVPEPEPVAVEPEPEPEPVVDAGAQAPLVDAVLLPAEEQSRRAVLAVPGASEVERGFVRLCAPASRLVVVDVTASGAVALVGLADEPLRRWAETYLVTGESFSELAAAAETHGYIAACVQAANVWAPEGAQITNFAILDHPVDDPGTTETELLAEHRCLVEQLVAPAA